jgi:hypothetical protein
MELRHPGNNEFDAQCPKCKHTFLFAIPPSYTWQAGYDAGMDDGEQSGRDAMGNTTVSFVCECGYSVRRECYTSGVICPLCQGLCSPNPESIENSKGKQNGNISMPTV